jgi:uncharacterized membrane protein YedE/YeeE
VTRLVVPAAAGLLFALGLGLSGMTDPTKVLGFLDVGGGWDPSLAFVMVGAIAVHFAFARRAVRRPMTLSGGPIALPTARAIDARLLVGAAVFGLGWGAAGFCPGPALVAAAGGMESSAVTFVLAMLLGIAITRRAAGR